MKRILRITNSIINNKIFIEFITIEKNSKGAKPLLFFINLFLT